MQNKTEREVGVLKAKLAALEEALRWRPIAEWPEEGFKDGPEEYELQKPGERFTAARDVEAAVLRLMKAAHFRPVLPGPEGSDA